jgi:HEAT repeat protein
MSDAITQIRSALAQMFALGLTRLKPEALFHLRQMLDASGFQRCIALLEELGAQKDPANRFKAFTKLLLALRQLEVAITPFPRLKAGGFVAVPGFRGFAVPQSYAALDGQDQVRQFLTAEMHRVPGLYVLAEKLEPARLTMHELVPLLSHGFYRDATLEKLKSLPDDRREALAGKLIELKGRPLRRAGVALLASLGARLSAMKALLPMLADAGTQKEASAAFLALGSRAISVLGSAVDSEQESVREQAAKLLFQIADKQSQVPLKRLSSDRVPVVKTWAKLGLAAIGAVDDSVLLQGSNDRSDHLMRIYSKLLLTRRGQMPIEKLAEDLGEGCRRQFKLAVPAIAELDEAEELISPTLVKFRNGQTKEDRRLAFELLQHLPYARFRTIFRLAAGDCDPDIARNGLETLIRHEGYTALDRFRDLSAVLTRRYEQLTADEKQYAQDNILLYLADLGDCRFVPYLKGLLRERCYSGATIEYTYHLRPMMVEFGAPLVPALKELARDPNPNICGAAREVLDEIGGKQA